MEKILSIALLGLLGGSVWFGIKGMVKLVRWKMWRQIVFFMVFIVGYPLIIKYVYNLEDGHLRLWASVPTVLVSFLWVLSGYFLAHFTEKWQALQNRKGKKSQHLKNSSGELGGFILLLVGAGLWYFGVTHPDLAGLEKTWGKVLMVASMFSMFFGLTRIVKARWGL